jgi:DTW domain-containing protein YfiP
MAFTKEEIARAKRESETGICEGCLQPQRDCLCDDN